MSSYVRICWDWTIWHTSGSVKVPVYVYSKYELTIRSCPDLDSERTTMHNFQIQIFLCCKEYNILMPWLGAWAELQTQVLLYLLYYIILYYIIFIHLFYQRQWLWKCHENYLHSHSDIMLRSSDTRNDDVDIVILNCTCN